MSPQVPMGQYFLLEKLAQGGMAEIYKGLAYDLHGIRRTVVIKKILPHIAANREFIDMLVDEAKIAVLLTHGNIAQIYDLGRAGNDFFIVMEYVDGWSISQIQRACAARSEPLPVPLACHLAAEVAAGLEYMHSRTDERGQPLSIVHRDVSPQNVIVSRSGTVKIIDFGIAKARTKLESTEVGILKGKFAYMSPEHARGEGIDHRSDLFSLGVILHEMLTGARLFKAKEQRETLRNVRRAEVQPPSRRRSEVSPELDAIVLRALARDRDLRFPHAGELRVHLLKVLHQQYPDFREAEVVTYLQTLFDEPAATPGEDDQKTPLLISDATQSALLAAREEATQMADSEVGAPAVLAELMRPFGIETVVGEGRATAAAGAEADEEEKSLTVAQTSWRVRLSAWQQAITACGSRCWDRLAAGADRVLTRPVTRRERWIISGAILAACIGLAVGLGHWPLRTWWRTWFPERAMLVRQTLPIGIVPVVATVSVTVTSRPTGAAIFIDEQRTGLVTPATVTGLIPGRDYRIGVFREGYKFQTRALTATEAIAPLEFSLLPDYGRIRVRTTPVAATIWINGAPRGRTPYDGEWLTPQTVLDIEVRAAGYRPHRRQVRIQAGHVESIELALERGE